MNYEKKYNEALERAKEVYHRGYYVSGDIEDIFPELKESEDERVRKEIIDFLISTNKYGSNEKCESWLAWLEKQNPVEWSEEDELMLLSTIQSIEMTNGAAQLKINWLKSLKERMK